MHKPLNCKNLMKFQATNRFIIDMNKKIISEYKNMVIGNILSF